MPPPPLDHDRIAALCRLARLELTPAETAALGPRLEAVLAAFSALAKVNTTRLDQEPPAAASNLRPDVAEPALPTDTVLANAARTAGGCFLVPRVVEG